MNLFSIVAGYDQRYRVLRTRLNVTDLLIDALLGTGVARSIEGELAQMMRHVHASLNEHKRQIREQQKPSLRVVGLTEDIRHEHVPHKPLVPVIAVDCPSGLNCDTGELDPLTIPAHITVTFAGPKRGHFRFPGASVCGELVVADIGISENMLEVSSILVEVATSEYVHDLLPERASDGHKGSFGRVLIAAGSEKYWGAPLLAARAAYRAGAGLVSLAIPGQIQPIIATKLPEAIFPHMSDDAVLTTDTADSLLQSADAYQAMLVGPGLDDADEFVFALLEAGDKNVALPPMVVDADALNALSHTTDWPAKLPPKSILTPSSG